MPNKDTITVEIPISDVEMMKSIQIEPFVISKLREAGIPVKGVLKFGGVESGKLVKIEDCKNFTVKYVWSNA